MSRTFTQPLVSLPTARREALTPFGAPMIIRAQGAETGGAFGVWETFTPPGQGPAPHTHSRETEAFYVLRSTYHFRCGEREFDAPEGTLVVLPPHIEHGWYNIGEEPGHMLGIVTPGGFEQMFLDIIGLGSGASRQAIASVEARYGIVNADTMALSG